MQTSRLVELALKGLEAERARIDREIAELRMQGKATTVVRARSQRRTRRLTAAGRKRLSDMMKARWAERRKAAAKK
jgi:hypothetical protein